MFDKRHYQNDPKFAEARKELAAEQERLMAKADMPESREEVRTRARNLGNKKTKNAKGRRWWDQR